MYTKKALSPVVCCADPHSGMARGEFLELTVVILILLEIVLLAAGIG